MRIGVTISRNWRDYEAILGALHSAAAYEDGRTLSYHKATLIHGASQMDWFVAGVAYMLGMTPEDHEADWQKSPRAAGHIRNAEMVRSGADVWLAFIAECVQETCPDRGRHGSHGATACANLAERRGIRTMRYYEGQQQHG